ncbi:MAG: proton-conducting membrane transporter [Oscillospiraceae bacterium]|nr:proton-conducting membrane transporter [Oscillospiraceae bacterium]
MPWKLVLGVCILLPVVMGFVMYACKNKIEPRINRWACVTVFIEAALVWWAVLCCPGDTYTLFSLTEGITLVLRFDGLGRFFAGLIATLWPLTTIYAFGYMAHQPRKGMFYAFFVMSFGVTAGVAMAGNLLTMYVFYELLTLSTLPLVMHEMDTKAVRAGRIYLVMCVGGAAFGFAAMVFFQTTGCSLEFILGGNLSEFTAGKHVTVFMFILGFFGFGVKTAVFPLYFWLISASVAPTPVTALLHAVAVVKAGAFGVIRLIYYVCGTQLLSGTWGQYVVLAAALVTMLFGSSMAVKETHFKRRVAYCTVSNLSYILMGAAMMSPVGMAAAIMHILCHAVSKILAFFCVGAVLETTHLQYIADMEGMGRKMPVTFATYTVAALSLTGIPPLCGFFSKWNLLTAMVEAGNAAGLIAAAVLIICAFLSAIYMLSVMVRAFFMPGKNTGAGIIEADKRMLVPMVIIAVGVILIGIFASDFMTLANNIATGLI